MLTQNPTEGCAGEPLPRRMWDVAYDFYRAHHERSLIEEEHHRHKASLAKANQKVADSLDALIQYLVDHHVSVPDGAVFSLGDCGIRFTVRPSGAITAELVPFVMDYERDPETPDERAERHHLEEMNGRRLKTKSY